MVLFSSTTNLPLDAYVVGLLVSFYAPDNLLLFKDFNASYCFASPAFAFPADVRNAWKAFSRSLVGAF
jgi:hypothetical protein